MLSRRAARRPGDELEVEVRPAPAMKLRAIDVSERALSEFVGGEQGRLLAPFTGLGGFGQPSPAVKLARLGGEYRSEEKFRVEVEQYLHELDRDLPKAVRARAVMHEMARLDLDVVNNTDRTYTGVRVELLLPSEVGVWDWRDDARTDAALPEPPTPYGTGRIASMSPFLARAPRLKPVFPITHPLPETYRRSDGVHVAFSEPAVRAQGVEELRAVWLVIANPATERIDVRWEATATNAEKRVSGSFTVPVQQPPARLDELLAELPEDDD